MSVCLATMSMVHSLHAAEMNSTINASIMSDAMSEPSSPESATFDESDLLNSTVHDDVTAQLASAGQKSHVYRTTLVNY